MPRYSNDECNHTLGMLQTGQSNTVTAISNVDHRTIGSLHKRFQTSGSVSNWPRSGHPEVKIPRQDQCVVLSHLKMKIITTFLPAKVTVRVTQGTAGRVGANSIRRRLFAIGLRNCRPYAGPTLTDARLYTCLDWFNQCTKWMLWDWNGVVFLNESMFRVSHIKGFQRIWWRVGERYSDCCVQERHRWVQAAWWYGQENAM